VNAPGKTGSKDLLRKGQENRQAVKEKFLKIAILLLQGDLKRIRGTCLSLHRRAAEDCRKKGDVAKLVGAKPWELRSRGRTRHHVQFLKGKRSEHPKKGYSRKGSAQL